MNSITSNALKFDKAKLIEILKKNRDAHKQEAEEAQRGYRETVLKRLGKFRKKVKRGDEFSQHELFQNLLQPQDHTAEYDLVIEMLCMCSELEIALTSDDFKKYVKDEWDWSNMAKFANSTYIGSNRR